MTVADSVEIEKGNASPDCGPNFSWYSLRHMGISN